MKFNPVTNQLFSNSGKFLKELHCPLDLDWEDLERISTQDQNRRCAHCDRKIIDTAFLTEEELSDILHDDKNTCLKIDLNQPNLIFTTDVWKP